jgi:hypothetical protein
MKNVRNARLKHRKVASCVESSPSHPHPHSPPTFTLSSRFVARTNIPNTSCTFQSSIITLFLSISQSTSHSCPLRLFPLLAMPKSRTSTRAPGEGRKGPFTKEQNKLIEQSFTDWHEFSLVKNPQDEGRGPAGKLTKWKQQEAEKILQDPLFEELPADVSITSTLSCQLTYTH